MNLKFELMENFLINFIKEEVRKTGIKKAICGLSGGIDSAVVAVLAKKALGDDFKAILLPSQYSSKSSIEDALKLCERFNIENEIISIAPLLEAYKIDSNFRIGNFSARMRMSILYDKATQYNALVLGTSNKSELMLGYGTIFADLASALNPIGDVYKSEIFEFAKFLNVNEEIISKPPSADLWEGQSDEDDLGYRYEEIDKVLYSYVEDRMTKKELLEIYEEKLVNMILKRIFRNHFKRNMPLIAKISSRTINHDFLYERDSGL